MIQKLFMGDVLVLPVIGLLLFVAIFSAALIVALRSRQSHIDAMAALPLGGADDGETDLTERSVPGGAPAEEVR